MPNRDKIINYINQYLEIDKFEDYCLNGLQVEGTNNVRKIVCGVSLNLELIEQAVKKKADMILVHHGVFGKNFSEIKGILKNRLKLLLENDINLAGYHLPLDAHPVVGNNILLIKKLGLKKVKKLEVGWVGKYEKAVSFENFVKKVDKVLNTKSYFIKVRKDKIKTVGIISGGASPEVDLAINEGVNVYVCGDIRENVVDIVKERKINFINAGHYRTEKFGIQELGKVVGKKFGVSVEFVEIDNEV